MNAPLRLLAASLLLLLLIAAACRHPCLARQQRGQVCANCGVLVASNLLEPIEGTSWDQAA